jgi:hypothetical protein
VRPATGEQFFRVIARPELGPAQLQHLGLEPALRGEGVSLERFRSEWSAYLRPGDLLASWNASTLNLLSRTLGEQCHGIALKSAYYNLKRFRGSLEQILAQEGLSEPRPEASTSLPRALQRLSNARRLGDFLRQPAPADAALACSNPLSSSA